MTGAMLLLASAGFSGIAFFPIPWPYPTETTAPCKA